MYLTYLEFRLAHILVPKPVTVTDGNYGPQHAALLGAAAAGLLKVQRDGPKLEYEYKGGHHEHNHQDEAQAQ